MLNVETSGLIFNAYHGNKAEHQGVENLPNSKNLKIVQARMGKPPRVTWLRWAAIEIERIKFKSCGQ